MKNWILKYNRPAQSWNEALPLGNGKIGAMVFGGVYADRTDLNIDTLWSGDGKSKILQEQPADLSYIRESIFAGDYAEAERYTKENLLGDWTESYLPAGMLEMEYVCIDNSGREFPETGCIIKAGCSAKQDDDRAKQENAQMKQSYAGVYSRELWMNRAVCQEMYEINGVGISKETIISREFNVLAIHFHVFPCHNEAVQIKVKLTSKLRVINAQHFGGNAYCLTGKAPVYAAPHYYECEDPIRYADDAGMGFAISFMTDCKDTEAESDGITLHVKEDVCVYLTASTSFDTKSDLALYNQELLQRAMEQGFDRIYRSHEEDFGRYFEAVELELFGEAQICEEAFTTEERLAAFPKQAEKDLNLVPLLFHYARYLLLSSSVPGTQPANLQGIWNSELRPPWSCNYTLNINTQMNYWIAETLNLSQCHEPLIDFTKRLYENGKIAARELYGLPGWVCHHNSDLWGHASPPGYYGADSLSCGYGCWPMASGWLCRHLWEHYAYTLDRKFLEETVFPILEDAVRFYLAFLYDDGKQLVTIPSTSPENLFLDEKGERHALTFASTMDISILRELFGNYLKCCEVLSVKGLSESVTAALQKLPGYRIGSKGQLQEWLTDYEEEDIHHRHISHLFAVYPADLIRKEDKELAQACRITLSERGVEGTGWCLSWRACTRARLGDGEEAYDLLKKQMTLTRETAVCVTGGGTYPNLLCAHPPFQIDGNFGYAAAVKEMLLQEHEDKIELLPALPSGWPEGSVSGFKLKGGHSVAFQWKTRKIIAVEITANADDEKTLICNEAKITVKLKPGNTWRGDMENAIGE